MPSTKTARPFHPSVGDTVLYKGQRVTVLQADEGGGKTCVDINGREVWVSTAALSRA